MTSQEPETFKGLEVLHFEQVELSKVENGVNSFLDVGNLAVLYLPSTDHFILSLNDWNYPLDKRFSVFTSSIQDSKLPKSYLLPTVTSFFTLKLNKIENTASIQNFETIIKSETRLSYQDETAGRQDDVDQVIIPLVQGVPLTKNRKASFKKELARMANTLSNTVNPYIKSHENMVMLKTIAQLKKTDPDSVPIHHLSHNVCSDQEDSSKQDSGPFPKEINEEISIIEEEIQRQRRLQEQEREIQEIHKHREQENLERERELQIALKEEQEQQCYEVIRNEERELQQGMSNAVRMIEQEKTELESEFKARQKEVVFELERRVRELRMKEEMTEAERINYSRLEKELLENMQQIEEERHELQSREAEIMNNLEIKNLELNQEQQTNEKIRQDFLKLKEEFKQAKEKKLAELKRKEKLTKKEHKEAERMEKEFRKIEAQEKADKWGLAEIDKKFGAAVELKAAELEELRVMISNKRLELQARERETISESDRMLAEIREKKEVVLSEEMTVSHLEKEAEHLRKTNEKLMLENERVQQEILQKLQLKKKELEQKESILEAEHREIDRLAKQIKELKEITDFEQTELGIDTLQFIQEHEAQTRKLGEIEKLLEVSQVELPRREEHILSSINIEEEALKKQYRRNELEKEKLVLIQNEIEILESERSLELRRQQQQLETIREYEAELLEKNIEVVQDLENLQKQIEQVKQEFETPSEYQLRFQAFRERFTKKVTSPVSGRDSRKTDVDSEGLNDTTSTDLTTLG